MLCSIAYQSGLNNSIPRGRLGSYAYQHSSEDTMNSPILSLHRPWWQRAADSLFAALARTPLFFRDEAEMRRRALELLAIFELDKMADETSTSLSYGNQRRLEIARAMMLEPKLLLLDEPAAGMNYGEAEGLKQQIRWLRDEFKISVVLVEHNMQVVMGVCEEIHVLDHGETIAHGTPDEIKKHPKVLAAYLGEESGEEEQAPLGQGPLNTTHGEEEPPIAAPDTTELS